MSTYERRRRQRRKPWRRTVALVVAFVLVFVVGIALGQALEDNPTPASTVTQTHTFTLQPPAETVTVTAP
jgi:ferric-dicitrate binding protein FerR (iron transport regulator)